MPNLPVVLQALRCTSWVQCLFLLVLAGNGLLILLGLRVVPSTLASAAGMWDVVARNSTLPLPTMLSDKSGDSRPPEVASHHKCEARSLGLDGQDGI
jgi:hypothetical protein